MLAPFWTDLNPGAAGAMRIGTLTDGSDTRIVLDWEAVREFSLPRMNSFQIWIGVQGDANPGEDITYAYGTIQGNGDGGFLSVGAENRFGNRGQNTYFNGTGTLPSNGTQLRVTGTPGTSGSKVITEAHVVRRRRAFVRLTLRRVINQILTDVTLRKVGVQSTQRLALGGASGSVIAFTWPGVSGGH